MKIVGWALFLVLYAAALITLLATFGLYEDGGSFALTTYIFHVPAVILASLVGMGVGLASKRSAITASGLMALLAAIGLFGSLAAPYAKNGDALTSVLQMWALPAALGALAVSAVGFLRHRQK